MLRTDRRSLLASSAASAFAATGVQAQLPDMPLMCGVMYDIGTAYEPEYPTRRSNDRRWFARELASIRNDLGCTWVSIFGTDIDRIVQAVYTANDHGLNVRVQPRFNDIDQIDTRADLQRLAQLMAAVPRNSSEIVFDIGAEWSLFAGGIGSGNSLAERARFVADHYDGLGSVNDQLNDALSQALAVVRTEFDGRITYGSGEWEDIDWSGFDIVEVDLYRSAQNADRFPEIIQEYASIGKPLWIGEFGCCTYTGAADKGAAGYEIVNWNTDPATLNGKYDRNEQEQADYFSSVAGTFELVGVENAFWFQFISTDRPYSAVPEQDLDRSSFGIVYRDDSDDYVYSGNVVPKSTFNALAAWNRGERTD